MKFLIKLLVKSALIMTAGLLITVYTEKSILTHIKSALGMVKKVASKLTHPLGLLNDITARK